MGKSSKNNFVLYFTTLLVLFFGLFQIIRDYNLWWDSGVYLGMGKFIFSIGQSGLWEPIRPLLWPILLGIIWKSGLNVLFFGKVLELLALLCSIFLVHNIAKKTYNSQAANYSVILFSTYSIIVFMAGKLYTSLPAIFFVLFSIHLLQKQKYFYAGIILGFAFMTKFTAGIFLLALFPLYFNRLFNLAKTAKFVFGFLVPVIPFLILNQIFYSNPFFPFIEANRIISQVLTCNYLMFNPWYYYFFFLLKQNLLNIFSLAGVFYSINNFNKISKPKIAVILCFILPLLYLTNLDCRIDRYSILFLPFLAMLSGYGISKLFNKQNQKIVILMVFFFSIAFFSYNYHDQVSKLDEIGEENDYINYLGGKEFSGELWSSNPLATFHTDNKVNMIYYPVYNDETSKRFIDSLNNNTSKISYVMIDNCGGGIICPSGDEVCSNNLDETKKKLDRGFKLVFNASYGRCYYHIYSGT